jgi:porphobilinogen synthase
MALSPRALHEHPHDTAEASAQTGFPTRRLRRLRMNPLVRDLVREASIQLDDLIYPLFVCPGTRVRKEIGSMPGVFNLSIDELVEECRRVAGAGIPGVILFGIPESKDEGGTGAWHDDGIVQRAFRAVRDTLGESLLLIADTCLCEYTSHGHCGVVSSGGEIENDPTLDILAKTAVSQARAGADIIAPSDMMDGRIASIRRALDENGFANTPILSYAVKYASSFYGPFREAAQGAPKFGDRKSHQMDPGNAREAIEEATLDLQEGADMLMVKPAMPYLDVLAELRRRFNVPLGAYQVSGEYAMIRAAGLNGWIDEDKAIWESVLGIKRAGADFILTYFAPRLAAMLAKR